MYCASKPREQVNTTPFDGWKQTRSCAAQRSHGGSTGTDGLQNNPEGTHLFRSEEVQVPKLGYEAKGLLYLS